MNIDRKLFKKNLKFFKKNKPSIYEFIKDINPSSIKIKVIENKTVQINSPKNSYIENFYEKYQHADIVNISFNVNEIEEVLKKAPIHSKVIVNAKKILYKDFDKKVFIDNILKSKVIPDIFINGIKIGSLANLEQMLEGLKFEQILIYEKNINKFFTSLYFIDWESIYESYNIFLIIGENEKIFKKGLSLYLSKHTKIIPLFFLHIYDEELNEKNLNILKEAVSLSFKGWGYYDDEKEALTHIYENIQKKIPYIKPLPQKKNSKVLIIGSGPSLEENIKFIKRIKDKAIIFSCGTAIHRLYKEGIVPDFQIELERNESRIKFFDDLPDDYTKKIKLIAADIVPYSLIKKYGKTYLFPREASSSQIMLNPKYFPSGIAPTVTNTATAVATFLGFENVFYLGVDMGYKNPQKKHASGTIYDKWNIERGTKVFYEVEGNESEKIFTDEVLLWAKNQLELLIKIHPNVKFFNLSKGAKIEGSVYIKNYTDILDMFQIDFNKNVYIELIENNLVTNYRELFNPVSVEKKEIIIFLNSFKEKIKQLEKIKDISERLNIIKESLKLIDFQNSLIKTIYGGTLKHLLIDIIYAVYYLNKNQFSDFINESLKGVDILISDLENIKKFLKIKID